MAAQDYLDFEIEIGLGLGREYPLAVIRSPGGEARGEFRFPFDELVLESRLKDLQIALLRSGGGRRVAPTPQEQNVQEFGQALFDALMTGEIRSRYDVSQREASRFGKGLRLKLRIQPPELARLPWEFMYDTRTAEYICLSTQTPLVRYIELPQMIQPLMVAPPLRILGLTASPRGLAGLDINNEKCRVETALGGLIQNGQVQITWMEHATWRDLQRAMRTGAWHILHFIGHGGFDRASDEGFIVLEDDAGELLRLPATQLGRLLADHATLRLLILNSCEGAQGGLKDVFSSTASILVRRGLAAVLAMQYEITDRAAIEFARGFYEALADGLPVDAATTEARKSVSMGVINTIEWGTPVLFMRAPDGILFRQETAVEKAVRLQAEKQKREQARLEKEAFNAPLVAEKALARERAAREQAEQEVQRLAADKVAKEKVEREVAEKAAREQAGWEAQRLVAEKAAKEKVEREAAEKAVRERAEREAQHLAAEKAAKEKVEREAAEKAARERTEREAQRLVEREAAEKAVREQVERERQRSIITVGVTLFIVIGIIWIVMSMQKPQANVIPTEQLAATPTVTVKQYQSAPPMTVDPKKQYFATFKMAKGGEFIVQLYPDKAPITVNSFVFLARDGFFNGVTFHRVLEGFMAQGGDPTGAGMGGPGYEFVNEDSDLKFDKAGVVAMANAGRDTNGSQFFITFAPTPQLNGGYTIFGQVTSGMEVVNGITRRDPQTNPTFTGDVIESVTISEK